MKRRIGRYLKVTVGLFIVSFAFNLFLLPNGLAAIGISGLALIFEDLYKIDISLFVLISNLLLITLSFCILGKKSTTLTIIGSILSPIFLKVTLPLTHFFYFFNIELIIQNLFILQTYQLVLVVFWLFQLLFHLANLSVQYEKFWQFDQL